LLSQCLAVAIVAVKKEEEVEEETVTEVGKY
jgi:hypothetical protein